MADIIKETDVVPALEDDKLQSFGYEQELKRSFGFWGMLGFSFSIVTSWTALSGVLIIGIESGGPPVMIYSWICICLLSLAVAYSLAELASAYPVAGGQYSWVAVLAPKSLRRGLSWVTGWIMLTGLLAMGATNNQITANFILGQANLVFPNYEIQQWQNVLVAYLVAIIAAVFNIWGRSIFDKLSRGVLIWNVMSFIIVIVTILATNDHKQSADFVFKEFQNDTGFSPSMAVVLGILQSAFGMCCYDAPAHMTEEMKNASKEAPRAIILSVYMGAVTGFIFLVTLSFCIGDIDATANTSTMVPIIQIFYDSTRSKVAACFLSSMITVVCLVASNSLLAEGSRSLYAFARDNGLPFSATFRKVDAKKQIPVNSIVLGLGVQMALNSIYYGPVTGFDTVMSIATTGFYLSYALPLFTRILAYFKGTHVRLHGSYSLSPLLSVTLSSIGLAYLLFAAISFNFPEEGPVTSETMNYTSAALGIIALVSVVTWFTTGHKSFTGPNLTLPAEEVDIVTPASEPSSETSTKA
ncbi:putative GABA permease [Xylariales sp. PMI_506]|nr:putative GABA permease [Xylariales sp. PMI_506]